MIDLGRMMNLLACGWAGWAAEGRTRQGQAGRAGPWGWPARWVEGAHCKASLKFPLVPALWAGETKADQGRPDHCCIKPMEINAGSVGHLRFKNAV